MGKLRENSILFHWNLTKTCSLLQKIMFWTADTTSEYCSSHCIMQFTLLAYFISEARMYPTIRDISDEILYWILVCICSSCFHFSPGFLTTSPAGLPIHSQQELARFFLLLIKCGSKHIIPKLLNLLMLHHFTQNTSFTRVLWGPGSVVLLPLLTHLLLLLFLLPHFQATSLATYSPDSPYRGFHLRSFVAIPSAWILPPGSIIHDSFPYFLQTEYYSLGSSLDH